MEKRNKLLDIDLVLLWFLALLTALTLAFFQEIPRSGALLALYLSCFALVGMFSFGFSHWSLQTHLILRAIFVGPFVLLIFSSLGFLIHYISVDDRHWYLLIWDRRIFGGDPVRQIHEFGEPWLTDVLQVAYASYYFLPMLLGAVLIRQKRWLELQSVLFLISVGFFLSYLGYFLCPAKSPNEILPGLWQDGSVIADSLARWTRQSEILKRDAFPSGHTEITLLTLFLAWKFHRKVFWAILPLGLGLFVATVYLGYHYLVDVVAGGVLALAVLYFSNLSFSQPGK